MSAGARVEGPNGFVWKPVSEGDGKLVVLLPSSSNQTTLTVTRADGTTETGTYAGKTNGGRPTFRFSSPGSAYQGGQTVAGVTIGAGSDDGIVGVSGGSSFNNENVEALIDQLANGEYRGGYTGEDVFGSVPEASEYEAVDPIEQFNNTLSSNEENLDRITDLVRGINDYVTQDSLDNIDAVFPEFRKQLAQYSGISSDYMNGQIPFDDVLTTVERGQEARGIIGTAGTTDSATLKDLGLLKMDVMNQGTSMFERVTALSQQISPASRRVSAANYLLDPTTVTQVNLQNAENNQASQQSANNLASYPDPVAANLFQLDSLLAGTSQNSITSAFTDATTSGSPSAFSNA